MIKVFLVEDEIVMRGGDQKYHLLGEGRVSVCGGGQRWGTGLSPDTENQAGYPDYGYQDALYGRNWS